MRIPAFPAAWAVACVLVASLLLAFLATTDATTAPGCDRLASPRGSDSNPGTKQRPFRTAQRLADSLSPSQVGCLREGAYTAASDDYVIDFTRGGSPGAPITVRSLPGERARVVGIVHVRRGADRVTLSGLDIEGTGEANTIKVYASDFVLADSNVTNLYRGWSCLILGNNTGGGRVVRPVVRGNVFSRCGNPANGNQDHAIYAGNVSGGRVVDNIFVRPSAYAIQFYPNAQRTLFAHNVVDGGAPSIRGGVVFGGDAEHVSNGNIVQQNIISSARAYNVEESWDGAFGVGNVVRRNCLWAGAQGAIVAPRTGFTASENVVANPRFEDRGGLDYRLKPGSPCLSVVGYDTAAKLRAGR